MPAHTPGPRGLPVIGNLHRLARDPLAFVQGIPRDYGDVTRAPVAGSSYVQIAHPELADHVLRAHKDQLIRDKTTRGLEAVLGQGLLTSDGPLWKRQRRLIAPSFTPKQLQAYADTMHACAEQRLPPEGDRNIHKDTGDVALDIVLRTLFGTGVADETQRVGPLLDEMMTAFQRENRTVWRMLPRWIPARHRRRVERSKQAFHDLLGRIIARARQGALDETLLLSRLLAARDDAGFGMDDDQLRDELITLFIAGHETTALGLAYTFLLLAEHPEIQARVHAELDATEPSTDWRREESDLLDACIKEALRLYPPAWAFAREALVDIDVDGHTVHAGEQLMVSPWVLHHDPRWWVGPDRFRPDRWLNGETDTLPKGAFMPFGAGPRVCVGQHFAWMELRIVADTWLRRRRMLPYPGAAPRMVPAVTLRPVDGIRVRVQAR
jgi:cytochrome P450